MIGSFTAMVQGFSLKFSNYVMGSQSICYMKIDGVKTDMKEIRIQVPT